MPSPPRTTSAARFVSACLLVLIATVLIPLAVAYWGGLPENSRGVYHAWAVVTALVDLLAVTGIILGLGYAVTGTVTGIALSTWNDYSLAKLQMALWTIVVLSGLFTAAKLNLVGYYGPVPLDKVLAITIPPELLAAMSIAAFSTAATPAILAMKASQDATPEQQAGAQNRVTAATGAAPGSVQASGKAIANTSRDAARWTDIVTGDEVANAGVVDLSKVQQLLITVLLIGMYEFLLLHMFGTTISSGITELPALDQHFIQLMAVSHAGYLVYKAVPKSGTTGSTTASVSADGVTSGSDAASPPVPAIPPNVVTVRVVVDDAVATQSLQLQVDGRAYPIGPDGHVELPLEMAIAHRLTASGTRGGSAVSGQTSITPTLDDMNKAYEITLA